MTPHPASDCRPRVWIDRCAASLRSALGGLDAGRASDVAVLLWERDAWRGDEPEQAALRHLQCEALLTTYRDRTGAMPHDR